MWGESRIESDGTIVATCEKVPAHEYFEVRALYPPEIFTGISRSSKMVREEIMEEEAGWAEEANLRRKRACERASALQNRMEHGKWVVIAVAALGLIVWFALYRKYGSRPQLPPPVEMAYDIPSHTPPALVEYLLNFRTVVGGALIGTMFDLAKRGFLTMREEKEEKKNLFGKLKKVSRYYWDLDREHLENHSGDLLGFERKLIDFIFEEIAEGHDSLNLEKMKKKRRKFVKFFSKWRLEVKAEADSKGWYDKRSTRGMLYSVAVSIIMLFLTGVGIYLVRQWAMVIGGAAIIVLILSFFIQHRTFEGELLARRWKALRKYLVKHHFRNADRSNLLNNLGDYFVYGAVLGVTQKIYKELAAFIPADNYRGYVPWYVYHGDAGEAFSPEAFSAAFSSMIATTSSSMSSASGSGGGASGGGGGGASSGGGGAG
ncbi:DUF2207 domain-containing protein [bacterium]|nr:DUF2207 domain-containing protein [bacterium]